MVLEYSYWDLLGYDTMRSGRWASACIRNILRPSSGCSTVNMDTVCFFESPYPSTRLHGVISKKVNLLEIIRPQMWQWWMSWN
jgi:hypothetical protein